ncbi:hypothetical protein [Brucella intermedia]|uniref:hypothetical protein n=1 Tax=Brucella intermedia TaxID=94625 RepID=UPI00165CF57E|nr:hypothetical protein [Brucella intermedia]QNQ41616.1 hypothetical protein IAR37_04040 [Brucella intermedia]
MVAIGEPARIIYTNYRGETAERTITPKRVWYGITDWHPEPQWFVTAFDHDKNADRDFALIDFGHPQPSATPHPLDDDANPLASNPVDDKIAPETDIHADDLPSDGSCVRCGSVPRNASGLCNTCLDEDAERLENTRPAPADAGKVEGDGRADLERFWRPISEADKSITFEQTFYTGDGKSMTIRNSDHYWVRDADGRVYEATWSDHKGGYWWNLEGESLADPVEYMPHPLSLPSALASEGAE